MLAIVRFAIGRLHFSLNALGALHGRAAADRLYDIRPFVADAHNARGRDTVERPSDVRRFDVEKELQRKDKLGAKRVLPCRRHIEIAAQVSRQHDSPDRRHEQPSANVGVFTSDPGFELCVGVSPECSVDNTTRTLRAA